MRRVFMRGLVLTGIILGCVFLYGEELLQPEILKQEPVHSGEIMDIKIPLVGEGEGVTWIQEVQFSCDCLRAVSFPRKLARGQKGELWVQLLASRALDYSYEVTVSGSKKKGDLLKKYLLLGSVKESGKNSGIDPVWRSELLLSVRRIVEIQDDFKILPGKLDFNSVMNEFYIVDIRNSGDYEKCYIPGSMRLSFSELKTKQYLKDKKILLIGYGYGEVLWNEELELLKERG